MRTVFDIHSKFQMIKKQKSLILKSIYLHTPHPCTKYLYVWSGLSADEEPNTNRIGTQPSTYSQEDEAHNIINTMYSYVYVQEIKFTKDFERCSYISMYVIGSSVARRVARTNRSRDVCV